MASPALTAWAALGLVAAGQAPAGTLDYLRAHEGDALPPATRALVALAAAALGRLRSSPARLSDGGGSDEHDRLDGARAAPGGAAGAEAARERVARTSVEVGRLGLGEGRRPRLERHRRRRPGAAGGRRDRGADPAARSTTCARRVPRTAASRILSGRESDAQSTAWAIQAFVAAGAPVPKGAFAYLRQPAEGRRQLPLLAALRHDARLGDRAGAAGRSSGSPSRFGQDRRHDVRQTLLGAWSGRASGADATPR